MADLRVQRLSSGYIRIALNRQAWAQWPEGREMEEGDVFAPSWNAARLRRAWEAHRAKEERA